MLQNFEHVLDLSIFPLLFKFFDKVLDLALDKGPMIEQASVNVGQIWKANGLMRGR